MEGSMNKNILFLGIFSVALTASADERIVGGGVAPAGAYPFFSSITREDGQHICGGALIASQWVLTAAHCIRDQSPYYVEIGISQYRPTVIRLERAKIAQAYIPKDYRGWQPYSGKAKDGRSYGQYDIALLKLESPAKSDRFLKLDKDLMEQVGDKVTLAGFGRTESGQLPDQLHHASGNIPEDKQCTDVPEGYPDTNFDPALNVCGPDISRGGDSGGPLLYMKNHEFVGLGLTSRGLLGAGQFTRISYYQNWMDVIMNSNKCKIFSTLSNNLPVCTAIPVSVSPPRARR